MYETPLCPQTDNKLKTERCCVRNQWTSIKGEVFRMSYWPEKEVRRLMWVKWRICHKIPFISSWLTGASGGGGRKSAVMCSEALANHTWPLLSTLANEWWPLGTLCCSALLKCQLQWVLLLNTNTGTSVWRHTVSTHTSHECMIRRVLKVW